MPTIPIPTTREVTPPIPLQVFGNTIEISALVQFFMPFDSVHWTPYLEKDFPTPTGPGSPQALLHRSSGAVVIVAPGSMHNIPVWHCSHAKYMVSQPHRIRRRHPPNTHLPIHRMSLAYVVRHTSDPLSDLHQACGIASQQYIQHWKLCAEREILQLAPLPGLWVNHYGTWLHEIHAPVTSLLKDGPIKNCFYMHAHRFHPATGIRLSIDVPASAHARAQRIAHIQRNTLYKDIEE